MTSQATPIHPVPGPEEPGVGSPAPPPTAGVPVPDPNNPNTLAVGSSAQLDMHMAMPYTMDPQYAEALNAADPTAMHKLHDMRQAYFINMNQHGFMHAPLTWMTPQIAPFLNGMPLPATSTVAAPVPEPPPPEVPPAKKAKTASGKEQYFTDGGNSNVNGGSQEAAAARPAPAPAPAGDKYSVDSLKQRERKRLEQNREAAKRFRQKKKSHLQDLSMKAEQLEADNNRLRQEYAVLLKQLAAQSSHFEAGVSAGAALPASISHIHMWWDQLLQLAVRAKQEGVAPADACEEVKVHLNQFVALLQKAINDGASCHLVNQDHCPHPLRLMLWQGYFKPTECLDNIIAQMSMGPIVVQLQNMRQQYEGQEAMLDASMVAIAEQIKKQIAEQMIKGGPSVAAQYLALMANQILQTAQAHSMFVSQLQEMLEPPDFLRALLIPIDCLAMFKDTMALAAQQPPSNLVMPGSTDIGVTYHPQHHVLAAKPEANGVAAEVAIPAGMSQEAMMAELQQHHQSQHGLAEAHPQVQAAALDAAHHQSSLPSPELPAHAAEQPHS